ncbi:MAG TPA: aminotransferase class V-fold PLP-dependent enzyme [Syntrophorhabdales bacterium]|nr:aminotransferase class V-fold PLP-dependent enzyme [Syntrophorhabdales bacterium]
MIYLDNAATSYPKPDETRRSLVDFVTNVGGNPGRSGHPLSIEAARIIFQAREKLTAFINGKHSERLVFTSNGTESLNLAILGLLAPHDHVIATSFEHNSVMRPLDFLQKKHSVNVSIVSCSEKGEIDLEKLKESLRKNTKAVIINHGSNVIGTVQPVKEIRERIGNTILIVDACQTVGNMAVDTDAQGIDIICFSCHKSLLGVQGLGALYTRKGIDLQPIKFGGTGSKSEFTSQPEFLPDKYECGTPNTPGIAALLGGLTFIENTGLSAIIEKKKTIRLYTFEKLSELDSVVVYGDPSKEDSLPIISMNVQGVSPSDVGTACNHAGICVRVGLHCAPIAHRTIGTFPQGTVRISPGYFTRTDEVDQFVEVVRTIVRKR